MTRTTYFLASLLLIASPVAAQSSFYAGGTVAADSGGRGPVQVGTLPAAGGLVGWRFARHWSVEFHADRAFGEGDPRIFEGLLLAQSAQPGERERTGVFGRSVWQDRGGVGWSATVVYTTREPGRVNAAVYGGVSERRFLTRHKTTITAIGPDVTYPPGHINIQDRDERITRRGGGLTGGVMFPIRLLDNVTVAPEMRVTLGVITDESTYKQFYTGARFMWGF